VLASWCNVAMASYTPQPPPPSAKQEPENREEYWFLLNAPKHLKTHTEGLLKTVVANRTEKLPNITPTQKGILPWRPSLSVCRAFQAPENEATIGQFTLLSITLSWNQSKCTFYKVTRSHEHSFIILENFDQTENQNLSSIRLKKLTSLISGYWIIAMCGKELFALWDRRLFCFVM